MSDSQQSIVAEAHPNNDEQNSLSDLIDYGLGLWAEYGAGFHQHLMTGLYQFDQHHYDKEMHIWSGVQPFIAAIEHLVQHPNHALQAFDQYVHDYIKLHLNLTRQLACGDSIMSVIQPAPSDRRFRSLQWQNNNYYNFMMQSYLLWDRWIKDTVDHIDTLDESTTRKLKFHTRQLIDAWAPGNFLHSNPDVMQETIDTGGQNLQQGLQNFLNDWQQDSGQLHISMVDSSAFEVGENIATTPGHVIFQNELMQIIQYNATTSEVYHIPLLLIPPCINKFYIYDLQSENSFVKWLLDQGFTVFMISWVNPDARLSHKSFEDYIIEGIETAVHVVKDICQVTKINTVGFCIGGNFLATYAAYNAHQHSRDHSLNTTTYLATLFDFDHAGDLRVFIDDDQVAKLEKSMHKKGYCDGQTLAQTFNLLRANDLIWSFMINNYMMGKQPQAFDLLFWNADSTNLPSSMYLFYLRNCFLENKLIQPGGMTIKNIPIDLSRVTVPSFILSTRDDHIAPWQSGYSGAQIFAGSSRFVLGGSGHIAGIFNHPRLNKYQYWTHSNLQLDAETWLEKATSHIGSWWIEWIAWLVPSSGNKIAARRVGSHQYKPIESAPGSYVLKKLSQPGTSVDRS